MQSMHDTVAAVVSCPAAKVRCVMRSVHSVGKRSYRVVSHITRGEVTTLK